MGKTRSLAPTIPLWGQEIARKISSSLHQEDRLLRKGIPLLAQVTPKLYGTKSRRLKHVLLQQPFDAHLLELSSLYHRSREAFLKQDGKFLPTLVTSPRSLSSPVLLENLVEYSPLERELIWSATDPIERKKLSHLFDVRTFSSSLFHEQNHRTLWRLLPPAPEKFRDLSRYLNFTESLVIALDMALGDELGPKLAPLFYSCGVTYNPGSSTLSEIPKGASGKRIYRTYLQAAVHAIYLNLELYEPEEIPVLIKTLFPVLGSLAERAAQRAGMIDRAFIHQTNLFWQERNWKKVRQKLGDKKGRALLLSPDPLDQREPYLVGEKVFEFFGL